MSTYRVLLAALVGLFSLISAFPTLPLSTTVDGVLSPIERRGPNCSQLGKGLAKSTCQHMSNIGMANQGVNAKSNNGKAWIGSEGPNKFKFTNRAGSGEPVTVVLWDNPKGDYQSSFMNARQPQVSYTLAKQGDSVTVSLVNGLSGGFAGLYGTRTTLTPYGQIANTWGEFTSGTDATVDISREVTMLGNKMSIKTSGGCTSDWTRCVFVCKAGDTCWERDSYSLLNCQAGSQPGASFGLYNGQPEGGCKGWENGGTVEIDFLP